MPKWSRTPSPHSPAKRMKMECYSNEMDEDPGPSNIVCDKVYDCVWCPFMSCRNLDYFIQHCRGHLAKRGTKCPKCGWQFTDEGFLGEDHLRDCLSYTPRTRYSLEPLPDQLSHFEEDSSNPPDDDHPIWSDPALSPLREDEDAVEMIRYYWNFYRSRVQHSTSLIHRVYHFRTAGTKMNTDTALDRIYNDVGSAWTFNIGLTVLLKSKNAESERPYMIFVSQHNRSPLFEKNLYVHNLITLKLAKGKVKEALEDPGETQSRPDTSWTFVAVLGWSAFVHMRSNYVAGGPVTSQLPSFLTRDTKNLLALEWDNERNLYTDRLCAFRAILAAVGGDYNNRMEVYTFYQRFREETNGPPPNEFAGIKEDEIPLLERVYGVRIQIFRKETSDKVICLRKTLFDDARPLVNLHSWPLDEERCHFSLIKSLKNFAGKFECTTGCGRLFKDKRNMMKHVRLGCRSGDPKFVFPGGTYHNNGGIFEKLLEVGVRVPFEQQWSDLVSVWDCEAILESLNQLKFKRPFPRDEENEKRLEQSRVPVEYVEGTPLKIQRRERHRVVCSALASSVPGFEEPLFFWGDDPQKVVEDTLEAMERIGEVAYRLEREKFDPIFVQLDQLKSRAEAALENATDKTKAKGALNKIQRLINDLEKHCRETIFLTFNGTYDLRLCKRWMYGPAVKAARIARDEGRREDGKWPTIVARQQRILSLTWDKIKIIDLYNFVAPGTSLAMFVSMFTNGELSKSTFPYELLRSPDVLETITELPEKDAFWSTLKNSSITDEQYDECKRIWNNLPEPRNLLQFLKFYCINDCAPTLKASQNMASLFREEFKVDLFKTCLTIPSFTMKFLFDTLRKERPLVRFGLMETQQQNLHNEIYGSICGGLAFLGKRYAVAGETPVRFDPAYKTKICVGLDLNSLYLHSLTYQPQPTGHPQHWTLQPDGTFQRVTDSETKRLKKRRCHGEVAAIKFYASWRKDWHVLTAEDGPQIRLGMGNWRADGFCKETMTMISYEGCRFHRHPDTGECLMKTLPDLTGIDPHIRSKDKARNDELKALGISVWTINECSFAAVKKAATLMRRNSPLSENLVQFIDEAVDYNEYLKANPKPEFINRKNVKGDEMEKAVKEGRVFGFIKLSQIRTKDEYKELYSDFPPLIRHALVGREQLDSRMRSLCEKKGVLKKPRDCLLGTYEASDIWLFSPLVVFYAAHGLEFKISQVLQYQPNVCFDWFGKDVIRKRRGADETGGNAALGETWKLVGNSAYGKTLTNLIKYRNIVICDAIEASSLHNSPFHCQTNEIQQGETYECHLRKKIIRQGLPIQCGLAVYGYAKLRILSFFYDVLLKYTDRKLWNLLSSDTDSIYLALAVDKLEDTVLPQFRELWKTKIEPEWFEIQKHQKREPGLWKIEAQGTHFVGLSPKSYVLYDQNDPRGSKFKSKGVQRRNRDIITFENFKRILFEEEGANPVAFDVSFRAYDNEMYTTISEKTGLSSVYIKRKLVEPFGYGNTAPLDM